MPERRSPINQRSILRTRCFGGCATSGSWEPVEQRRGTTAEPKRITVRIKEACRITGIGQSKLYALAAEGAIDIVRIGP